MQPNIDVLPAPSTMRPTQAATTGLRILLAEDNDDNLKLLTIMLTRSNHRVTPAHNGAEALALLAQDDFDLVLMDIQMPVMDGVEAVRRIRASRDGVRNPAIPVVALTAYAMSGDREKFLAAGMDDYLPKPVVRAKLDALLRRYLPETPLPGG